MVQNNKVLTVSYGTFSCTLEGFDDSFETMKAIAEYFRDLAAEDRYFGSEPPQPDAEMLTRIARRDQNQQVEARQSESGLLLRATEAPQTQATENVAQPAAPTPEPQADMSAPLYVDAEPVEDTPPPAADSIAAKLQRIRAVVSHSTDSASGYSEEEDTGLLGDTPEPVDAVALAFEAGALSAQDFEPEHQEEPAPMAEAAAPEKDFASVTEPAEDLAPVSAPELEEDASEETTPEDALFSDLDDAAEQVDEEDEITNILSVDEAEETDETEETTAEAASDDIADDTAPAALTAEDESGLLSEIDEIETELSDQLAETKTDEVASDLDVSRLMDEADAQMDDPSTSGTRDTYSHLRTAVAATEAEGNADANAKSADQDYRGDLASVVSPRRPEIQVTSMRPESDNAAPLKLVAEQRIDDREAQTGPVTPRRVTAEHDEAASEESGFAQFAQDQGAQSLPDLLEAAAAYLSFIEGQEKFSRPQLMNKVRSLKQDEFNREESLRTFGQLLRDGKIEKAGGGRFAASSLIGFRPDDERAVG